MHDYDSMIEVIRGLSDEDKKKLVEKVQTLVGSSGIEALTSFIATQVNREMFINVVREFASKATSGG